MGGLRLKSLVACGLCLLAHVSGNELAGVELDSMIEKTVPLRTHSLAAPYVDSDLQNRWWDFGEDAIINTNKHVRLTQDRSSQKGWLWSRMPLNLPSWQIDVEFTVDGKANSLFGDGFAIWIAKDRGSVGPVFGSVDYFTGLGIFFDTYANARHAYQWPRVTAMLGDGKTSYDHDHDNANTEAAACSEKFRRRDGPTRARMTYLKNKHFLLELQTKGEGEWTKCFELDTTLPASPYIGFSAATGEVHDNHDIVSISTSSVVLRAEHREKEPSGKAYDSTPPNKQKALQAKGGKKPKSSDGNGGAAGWFLFILKLIGVGAFIAFALAAYRTYNAQKKSRRAW